MVAPDKLKQWQAKNSVTNQDLARRVGVSCPYVSQWRSGARRPGRDKAVALEAATGGRVRVADWREDP